MTPQERAEQLVSRLEKHLFFGKTSIHRKWFVESTIAQIEEACTEAYQSGRKDNMGEVDKAFLGGVDMGFTAAKEKAKGIAKEAPCTCGVWSGVVVNDIDKMEPDQ